MRHLVVFAALLCAAIAVPDDRAQAAAQAAVAALKATALKCVTDSGLTTAQLRECCAADPTQADVLTKHKKFTHCMQRSVGILQDDGTVNPERAERLVQPHEKARMLEIARNCLGGDTTDLDEKAYNVSVCYRAANSTMYVTNCNLVLDVILS